MVAPPNRKTVLNVYVLLHQARQPTRRAIDISAVYVMHKRIGPYVNHKCDYTQTHDVHTISSIINFPASTAAMTYLVYVRGLPRIRLHYNKTSLHIKTDYVPLLLGYPIMWIH